MVNAYRITSKEFDSTYAATNFNQAIAKFFKQLTEGKIPIESIGQIINVYHPDGENRPFRTAPSAVLLKIIERDIAIAGLVHIIGCSTIEAEEILDKAINDDGWIVGAIQKLNYFF